MIWGLLFVVLAYGLVLLVGFLRGAERMHSHSRGMPGFMVDLTLAYGGLLVFAAVVGILLLSTFEIPAGLVGWLIINGAGLTGALIYSFIPPVRAAHERLDALRRADLDIRP